MVAEGDPLVVVSSPWWLRVTCSAKEITFVPSTSGGWAKYAMGECIMCRYTQMLTIIYTDISKLFGFNYGKICMISNVYKLVFWGGLNVDNY